MSSGGTLFWTGLVVVGVILVAPGLDGTDAPPAVAEAGAPPQIPSKPPPATPAPGPAGNGFATQELVRGPDGHFYAEAQVNGAPVRFMIDTGATVVALTREDAQRAGILFGTERAVARGVGGDVEVIPVTIDRLAVGPLQTTQIRAAVVDDLDVSLLGQSFLSRVGSVEIRDDRMLLR
jgi:aspartyl protease family protein